MIYRFDQTHKRSPSLQKQVRFFTILSFAIIVLLTILVFWLINRPL